MNQKRLKSNSWKLLQTKQCSSCPWRVDSKLEDIPNYSRTKHLYLRETIAENGVLNLNLAALMACHKSHQNDLVCIGWLHNQLGIGNNLGLRLTMSQCENADEIQIRGKQHQSFEETFKLPNNPSTFEVK